MKLAEKTITSSVRHSLAASTLPALITPAFNGEALIDAFHRLHRDVEAQLHTVGGVLFRGFYVPSVEDFQRFAAAFGHPLLKYEFGSTPRSAVASGIYTSTEYPAHQHIPLHNEQAYTREWPMKIWFHCVVASEMGGETPIADSRAIYRQLSPPLVKRFTEKRLMYVRNYGNGLDLPWEQVFNTDHPEEVERYCHAQGIRCEWKADGGLTTRDICQAVARHPYTSEMVWFNQAHLFHISNLDPTVREALLAAVGEDELPRNVYYGDGTPIEESALNEVRAVLAEEAVVFPWQPGDVLMLDNMLAAHGRTPFSGKRRVVVAMAESYGEQHG